MTNREIKRKAAAFLKEHGLLRVDYESLRQAVAQCGYTVIEYNHIFNDEDVQALIDALRLTDDVLRSRGFTYADWSYRLVFVHEDLSAAEKLTVLAHEAGHICLEHMQVAPIIGRDVQQEHEANEFAHFLTSGMPMTRAGIYLRKHKALTAALAAGIVLVIAGLVVTGYMLRERQYYGEYYITSTGDKYHEADCIFVKDKTTVSRLTIEEFESGEYDRCQICLP